MDNSLDKFYKNAYVNSLNEDKSFDVNTFLKKCDKKEFTMFNKKDVAGDLKLFLELSGCCDTKTMKFQDMFSAKVEGGLIDYMILGQEKFEAAKGLTPFIYIFNTFEGMILNYSSFNSNSSDKKDNYESHQCSVMNFSMERSVSRFLTQNYAVFEESNIKDVRGFFAINSDLSKDIYTMVDLYRPLKRTELETDKSKTYTLELKLNLSSNKQNESVFRLDSSIPYFDFEAK